MPEGGRPDHDAFEAFVAGKIVLGQRRPFIGQFWLVADQRNRPRKLRLPQGDRRLSTTMPGAHNDYIRALGHRFDLTAGNMATR